MRFYEFRKILEAPARIQHAEDLVFWEGSAGALRALQSLKSISGEGHKDVTIKWDGSPAIIFGRNEQGQFVLTDKSGFGAKGYNGKTTSADDLEAMLKNRPGYQKNPEGYGTFINNMRDIFDEYEKAVPKDFRGFFKGDLLYFNKPQIKDKNFIFKPNIVQYAVSVDSDLGKKIARSKTGVVIHRLVDPDGTEQPLKNFDIFQGEEVLVVPPISSESPVEMDTPELERLEQDISKFGSVIDKFLNTSTLESMKMKDLPQIFYTYMNSKVDTGLSNFNYANFEQWTQSSKLSDTKKQRVLEYVKQNVTSFDALFALVVNIMKAKDSIIAKLDKQSSNIKQSIGKKSGGEGYVLAHPGGDIKLVPRASFSAANRAVKR